MDSDPDLIRRTLEGDADAFGHLVDRYKDAVYGAAYARVEGFHDAQDVAQETFIQAYRRLASLREPDRFGSWLYAIAVNVARDHLRRRRETLPVDETALPGQTDPGDEHDRHTLHRRIQQALATLSEVHRETVTLYYINGYTCDEVGGFLNVPSGTIKRRLSDARRQLRKEMLDMVRDMFDAHKLPSDFRNVIVEGVYPDPRSNTPRLLIRDQQRRGFSIAIDPFQANAICMHLYKEPPPRPITYDLFSLVCNAFGITLSGVEMTRRRKAYQATVAFNLGKKAVTLEANPGDAVALAQRFDAPVCVNEDALKGAPFQHLPEDKDRLKEVLLEGMKTAAIPPPKAPKVLAQQPMTYQVDADNPWAVVDRAGGRVKKVRILISATLPSSSSPPPQIARPTERIRLRRLASPRNLLTVRVFCVTPEQQTDRPLVWLEDDGNSAALPIAIGPYEAMSIAAKLPTAQSGLPDDKGKRATWSAGQAFDLLKEALDAFEIVHERAVIDLLHGDTFFAFNFFRQGKTVKRLDARPSDSVALAMRTEAGLYLHREVLDRAKMNVGSEQYRAWREKVLLSLKERRKGKGQIRVPYPLQIGHQVRFVVQSRRRLTWRSSDPAVATVTQDGLIEALMPGSVTIIAE